MKKHVITVTLNPAIDKTVSVSRLVAGGLNRVQQIRIDAGGKGINVAKVMNRFGMDVITTGFIGGIQGQLLLEYLEREKLQSSFIKIPGETRTNLKIVEEHSKSTTEVNEPGLVVSVENLKLFEEELERLLDQASFLVLSGSLPPGVEDGVYARYIELAKSKGVKTVLDADGNALKEGIKAAPFAVKPNIHELESLSGRSLDTILDIAIAAVVLLEAGIEVVAVSMGVKGAVVMDREESYLAKTFDIVPASTVGAGDSMVAALCYSNLNNYSLSECARWMTAAGTITASKPGTDVCSFEEVEKSIGLIKPEKL